MVHALWHHSLPQAAATRGRVRACSTRGDPSGLAHATAPHVQLRGEGMPRTHGAPVTAVMYLVEGGAGRRGRRRGRRHDVIQRLEQTPGHERSDGRPMLRNIEPGGVWYEPLFVSRRMPCHRKHDQGT